MFETLRKFLIVKVFQTSREFEKVLSRVFESLKGFLKELLKVFETLREFLILKELQTLRDSEKLLLKAF
jgi:hypothetical protein